MDRGCDVARDEPPMIVVVTVLAVAVRFFGIKIIAEPGESPTTPDKL